MVISSQTITLSSCPDIILVWVKPNIIGSTRNIPYVPITRAAVTFDNFSNLCSNFQQQHLYACTTAAGIAELESGKSKVLLASAVAAAHKRAKELGGK